MAEDAAGTARFTAVLAVSSAPARGSPVGPWVPPVRPPTVPRFGNASCVVLPSSGATRPLRPHWMPTACANSRVV